MDNNFIVADNEKKEDAAGRLAQKLDALIKEAEKIDKENERLNLINSELHAQSFMKKLKVLKKKIESLMKI